MKFKKTVISDHEKEWKVCLSKNRHWACYLHEKNMVTVQNKAAVVRTVMMRVFTSYLGKNCTGDQWVRALAVQAGGP